MKPNTLGVLINKHALTHPFLCPMSPPQPMMQQNVIHKFGFIYTTFDSFEVIKVVCQNKKKNLKNYVMR